MKFAYAYLTIQKVQEDLYDSFNDLSESNPTLGYLGSIPVAVLDVSLAIAKFSLTAIEGLAMAAINLVGAAFSNEFTLEHAWINTRKLILGGLFASVVTIGSPIFVVYQSYINLSNPTIAPPFAHLL